MKLFYFLIINLFAISAHIQAFEKTSITSELLELRGELTQASSRVAQLRKDKQAIEESFKNLESWAANQQAEKIQVYEENNEIRNLLSNAEQRVVKEKIEHKKTADKYDKIKSIMGYLAGAFLALIYIRLGSSMINMLTAAGPWGVIIQFLGPMGAFAAGYMFIQYYF